MKVGKTMNILNAENVFETLTGSLCEEYTIPGVENAFATGTKCAKLYTQIYWANQRLCARLGQTEYDPAVELIINNFMEINQLLCLQMYQYGKMHRLSP